MRTTTEFRSAFRLGVADNVQGQSPEQRPAAVVFGSALSACIQQPVEIVPVDTVELLLNRLLRAEISMAWLPTLYHLRALDRGADLLAICARQHAAFYRIAVLVSRYSAFNGTLDLESARFAWHGKRTARHNTFAMLTLLKDGLHPRAFYADQVHDTPESAARAVGNKEADVCFCHLPDRVTEHQHPFRAVQAIFGPLATHLRVLKLSDPIPYDGLVVNPTFNSDEKAALLELLTHANNPELQQAAGQFLRTDSFTAASDEVRGKFCCWPVSWLVGVG